MRILEIFLKKFFETVCEVAIVNREIQFFVESERAIVEVRASDGCPDAVDHHRLGVHERCHVLKDLYAAQQHSAVITPAGAVRDLMIYLAGHQHGDMNAPGGGL